MASLTFIHFRSLPRNQMSLPLHRSLNLVQLQGHRLQNKWSIRAVSRKKTAESSAEDGPNEDGVVVKKKTPKASKQTTTRTKKKATSEENEALGSSDVETDALTSVDDKKKTPRKTRQKATSAMEEDQSEKKVRKRKSTRKKNNSADVQDSELDVSNVEPTFIAAKEEDQSEKKVRKKSTKKKNDSADVQGSELDVSDVKPTFIAAKEEDQSEKVRKKKSTKNKNDSADVQGSESDLSNVEPTFIAAMEEDQSEKVRRRTTKKKYNSEDEQGSESKFRDVKSTIVAAEKEDQSEEVRRTTKKQYDSDQDSDSDVSDVESTFIEDVDEENDDELDLVIDEGEEDISFSYPWPPLVCCFGSAQHPFVPSGRPAERRVEYEFYERLRDAVWIPENFVRAPGGSAANVAVALARLGGTVAFMGKLGNDTYGWNMVDYLNAQNVQTRSVCLDSRRSTAATKMKIPRRGQLRVRTVKPCAEDSLLKSEINIDVLKEAKMFYVNTHSLLDTNMRSTALRAIKIAKKFGALIFYDVNIPLPLWRSAEETRAFIQQVWNLADIIEITSQELEFIYGIKPSEEVLTNNKLRYRLAHYDWEVIAPIWHENLKLLFVTNGTSLIHYYTSEHYGAVRGGEDPPITPYTGDMSASGDGIVAGLLQMLTLHLNLITDAEHLKSTCQNAIETGFREQWILEQKRGYPPREGAEVGPDENGIRSVTEKGFRTLQSLS